MEMLCSRDPSVTLGAVIHRKPRFCECEIPRGAVSDACGAFAAVRDKSAWRLWRRPLKSKGRALFGALLSVTCATMIVGRQVLTTGKEPKMASKNKGGRATKKVGKGLKEKRLAKKAKRAESDAKRDHSR